MPRVPLDLPSLLRSVLAGTDTLSVQGDTVRQALEDAYQQVPALRSLLCDESGTFRPHVLCFLNEVNVRWLDGLDERLKEGDQITILQAVSGG